ncbi:MAG: glycosyl hydrolase [Planctomycetota bacterium]
MKSAAPLLAIILGTSSALGWARPQDPVDPNTKEPDEEILQASTFSGLALRGIGPAFMSGRISDIAVHPSDKSTWYVTVACGGVWKTTNAGTTWTPIFDDQGSYSIGCVTIDPGNPLTVWVGTGENNSQRSVGYGDGVYRSSDGGRTWKKMGLEQSEHIGKILVDPRDSNVVWVAAQGPLWAPGGERGLFKTTDGGKSWTCLLAISENTGVSDIVFDPRNPDVVYASSYQRRRHVWTLINGGPEGAIYKSTDGGASWEKLSNGLPSGDIGRIGLAVSSIDPDVVYALVEATGEDTGFYRSADGGASWEKRSGYDTGSAQYYQEIYADPHQFDRVYSMDTWMMVTEDGGKTFRRVGEKFKHVDNHALVFDPDDPDYLLAGCDGGVYESFDRGATWLFKANLPVTQFYKVCVDNDRPFYNVYGGTQDNNTQGGPSRTTNIHGIRNGDWFVTLGGDGFKPQVDPNDPNIVYSQLQYGNLVRYDRRNGEKIDIQPQPGPEEPQLRWNWDSAFLLSPHCPTRLYFAANILFRSDDRGDSWRAVSGDLTRQIDRNQLKVMGRVWSVDAVAKNNSTSFYGNIVSLSESPLREGLIYAGTDDGLIQVTEDGGEAWRRIETFPGVPERSYVADIESSRHDVDTVYALFNNHKMADFKPYVLKSTDRGRTWTSIAGDLPARGSVWALAEDHVKPELLFVGTEFALFFTADNGAHWIQLKGGVPVIAFRDLEIQRREEDLVGASFGRGFYILDDYSPLRTVSRELLEQEAVLFPVKDALMYIQSSPLGWLEKGSQGDAYFTAPNPPFGAVFTYYLKEGLKTRKERRREAEDKIKKEGGDTFYPPWDELRAEDREEEPTILLVVTDEEGGTVRRLSAPAGKGFHRVAWNLRYPAFTPASLPSAAERDPWDEPPSGPMAAPGTYNVRLYKRVDGQLTAFGEMQTFKAVPLGIASLPGPDKEALLAFQMKTGRLQRAVLGANHALQDAREHLKLVKQAIDDTPAAEPQLGEEARAIDAKLADLNVALNGDSTVSSRNEPTVPGIVGRVQAIVSGHWSSTSAPTATHARNYEIAAAEFEQALGKLRVVVEQEIVALEAKLEAAGAPWTPGRVPTWRRE